MSSSRGRTIAVAGGTGLLGRMVVNALRANGAQVRVLSRHPSSADDQFVCDLATGEGLASALAGADAFVWCAHDREADGNDGLWMRNVLVACKASDVAHLVYTGIAGIEPAASSPYYAGKLREERIIEASAQPHTILRAVQFHTLALALLEDCCSGGVIRPPRHLLLRPIAPETVAERLAALALAEPRGRVADLAGPEDCRIVDLARAWVNVAGLDHAIEEVDEAPARWSLLGKLAHGPADRAGPDFAAWLTQRRTPTPAGSIR